MMAFSFFLVIALLCYYLYSWLTRNKIKNASGELRER